VNYIRLPLPMRLVGMKDSMSFHMTLPKALEQRPGASLDFRAWAEEMIEGWRNAENLCAAHTATLTAVEYQGPSIHDRLLAALDKTNDTLAAHSRK